MLAALAPYAVPTAACPTLHVRPAQRGAPLVPSLDPQETNVENPPSRASEAEWRFRFCAELRSHLIANLDLLGLSRKHRDRFEACGADAWVQYSPSTNKYRVRAHHCKLRWCPACKRSAGKHAADWLASVMKSKPANGWKLITLTLRSSTASLTDQLKHLRTAFRRLRQRALWRHACAGGVYVFELTYNAKLKRWHPHVHILADAKYIPQTELARQWLQASRSSKVVDIRAATDPDRAAAYIAKYLTKSPPTSITLNLPVLAEYIKALNGCRLISRFGSIPKYKQPSCEDVSVLDWEPVQTLASLLAQARAGDPRAIRILTSLGDSTYETIQPDLDHHKPPSLPRLPHSAYGRFARLP